MMKALLYFSKSLRLSCVSMGSVSRIVIGSLFLATRSILGIAKISVLSSYDEVRLNKKRKMITNNEEIEAYSLQKVAKYND